MGISEVLHKQHLSAPSVMEDTGVPSHEATNFCLTTRVVYRLAQRPRRRECCGCVRLTLWYTFTAIQRVERLPLAVLYMKARSCLIYLHSVLSRFGQERFFKIYFNTHCVLLNISSVPCRWTVAYLVIQESYVVFI